MTQVELLDKTEIWVRGTTVSNANLPDIAKAVANFLELADGEVFVTDIGSDQICFDVHVPRVSLEVVAGREQGLLDVLRKLPGVTVSDTASVHSEGILGVIGAPPEQVANLIAEAQMLDRNIASYLSQRVAVVSTGFDLVGGLVHDTNFEAAQEILGSAGYEVVAGGSVPDDEAAIAGRVLRLAQEGFGLIITTGGVGAEAKDRTVEAISSLDSQIATADLARYEVGHGRHVKEAVRIAIARVEHSVVVALPGPTREVRLALPVLIAGLTANKSFAQLVEEIAAPLRQLLPRHGHHAH